MKKSLIILFSLIFIVILSGCTKQSASNQTNSTSEQNSTTTIDISSHNTPQDCWTIVNGTVYNITSYIASGQHPGPSIDSMCGVDGTKIYNSMHVHSQKADNLLEQYKIN